MPLISFLGTMSFAVWLSATVAIPRADKAKSFRRILAFSSGIGKRLIGPTQPYVNQCTKVDSGDEIGERPITSAKLGRHQITEVQTALVPCSSDCVRYTPLTFDTASSLVCWTPPG